MDTKEDLAGQMREATEALARARRPILRANRTPASHDFSVVVPLFVIASVVACALIVGASGGGGAPAAVTDTSGMVRIDGARPADGHLYLTTVRSARPQAPAATSRVAMDTSKRNAIRAASSCVDPTKRRGVSLDVGEITGGSAGLMLALGIVDALEPFHLEDAIAGSGTIRPDGGVGPVLELDEKARAALDAGAEMFLVPKAQLSLAERAAPGLRVVGVSTLDEAVRALGRTEGCHRTKGEKG